MITSCSLLDRWTRPDQWPLIGAAASGAMLAGAFAFEVFGRYSPCPLCIDQRWAHGYVIATGLILYGGLRLAPPSRAMFSRLAAGLIAVLFGFSAKAAIHHAGGEYDFWTLDCQARNMTGLTVDALLDSLSTPTPVVLCDEPAWTLLGISMAGYNALFSIALGVTSLVVVFRKPFRSA